MIKSYFTIALRSLSKNKIYSFINIAGLSLSLACVMLIILYTKDEFSFDKFHKESGSIYQITIDVQKPDGSSEAKVGPTSIFHGPRFIDAIPEFESFVRLNTTYRDIKLGDNLQSQIVMSVDENFFTFFTFPLVQGNPLTALQQPNGIVISEDIAIRQFGTTDALNKIILFESEGTLQPYTVTAVAKRCPQNSSIKFEVLMPLIISTADEQELGNWLNLNLNTFIKLANGSDRNDVESKMQKTFEQDSKVAMDQVRKFGFDQSFYHHLQPLSDIHLSQEYIAEGGLVNPSNPMYSYLLSGIAIFILIIACINFINLTIARSVKRAKEIGIRKVIGGGKQQLIFQFFGESFLLCTIAFIVAVLLAQLALPFFNSIVNKELSLSYLLNAQLITSYIGLLIFTGFLAGFYPALVLSGYNPVETLYNKFKLEGKNYLQKSLITFQFALATVMIMATTIVYQQFDYLISKDLGYTPDNVVRIMKKDLSSREAKIFKEQLSKNPSILSVAPQEHVTMNGKINTDSIRNFVYEVVDENFIDLLKIQILEGRNFSPLFPSDSSKAVLINETFAKMAGWTDPIGKEIHMMPFAGDKRYVVGVVKNYHFASLKKSVEPQVFIYSPDSDHPFYGQLLIRIKPNSESTSLQQIEKTFKSLFPLTPYSYQFYNEINNQTYDAESKWRKVILLSSVLIILIAGMGLFGLSSLSAERRFKEIGIRKVLGASINRIVLTLLKDIMMLICFALIIAMPLGYLAITNWLSNYPYRVEVSPEIFIGTGVFVWAIALATVSYQSIKAALINPVESLKVD
jgi:putative ABC transport system permease protein